MVDNTCKHEPHNSDFSQLQQSNSAQWKDWSKYSLRYVNSCCYPQATKFFVASNSLEFEHCTVIKVSIHCRKLQKHHCLQFSNGWGADIWYTHSLMRIAWEGLKELIFFVYCIQRWRDINLWTTGSKSIYCKSVSFPFKERGAIFRESREGIQSFFLIQFVSWGHSRSVKYTYEFSWDLRELKWGVYIAWGTSSCNKILDWSIAQVFLKYWSVINTGITIITTRWMYEDIIYIQIPV